MTTESDLVSMGFALDRVREAIREKGQDLEAALQWLVDQPPPPEAPANASAVESELCAMGFERDRVKRAIRARGEEVNCLCFKHAYCFSSIPLTLQLLLLRPLHSQLEPALQWLIEGGAEQDEQAPPAKVQRRNEAPRAPVQPPMQARAAPAPPAPPPRPAAPPPRPAAPPHPPAAAPPRPAVASSSALAGSASGSSCQANQRSLKRLMKEFKELHALEQQGGCRQVLAGFC